MIRRALDFPYRGADRGLQVAHMLEGGSQRLGQRLREPASLTGRSGILIPLAFSAASADSFASQTRLIA
jgi:hypothetical protein